MNWCYFILCSFILLITLTILLQCKKEKFQISKSYKILSNTKNTKNTKNTENTENTENFEIETTFDDIDVSNEYLQYMKMNGHRTLIKLQKGNNGDNVILLHNSPLNLNVWIPLFQTMQKISMTGSSTPNLIAYDLRGHGTAWIDVPKGYNDNNINNTLWSLEDYVEDCKRIYDKIISKGKIIICGFGFGGKIAQKFSLIYPNIIKKLFILQNAIRPTPNLMENIDFVSKWIKENPNITYLTVEKKWIHRIICGWLHLPKDNNCDDYTYIEEKSDDNDSSTLDKDKNDEETPQYDYIHKMYREASAETILQVYKLLAGINLEKNWQDIKDIDFPIHILTAKHDPLAPPSMMMQTYTSIYNHNRSLNIMLDIVDGKHGFTMMNPAYIAGIICPSCTNSSIKTLTRFSNYF